MYIIFKLSSDIKNLFVICVNLIDCVFHTFPHPPVTIRIADQDLTLCNQLQREKLASKNGDACIWDVRINWSLKTPNCNLKLYHFCLREKYPSTAKVINKPKTRLFELSLSKGATDFSLNISSLTE